MIGLHVPCGIIPSNQIIPSDGNGIATTTVPRRYTASHVGSWRIYLVESLVTDDTTGSYTSLTAFAKCKRSSHPWFDWWCHDTRSLWYTTNVHVFVARFRQSLRRCRMFASCYHRLRRRMLYIYVDECALHPWSKHVLLAALLSPSSTISVRDFAHFFNTSFHNYTGTTLDIGDNIELYIHIYIIDMNYVYIYIIRVI